MSTWLTESEYALAFFVALVLLLLGPWISRQYSRFGRLSGWPGLLSAATIAYACAILAFTLFPIPRITAEFCEVHGVAEHIQLVPFRSFLKAADQFSQVGIFAGLTSFTTLQIVFNVVFFVPLGFLLGHRWRKGLVTTLLLGLGLSLLIETTQGTAVWGLFPCPYRVAEVDDLITNTTGAMVGWLLAYSLRHRLPDPQPPPVPDLERPGLVRRAGAVLIDVLVLFEVILVTVVVSTLAIEVLGLTTDTQTRARRPRARRHPDRYRVAADRPDTESSVRPRYPWVVVRAHRRGDHGRLPGSTATPAGPGRVPYLPLMVVGLPWLAYGLVDLVVARMRSDRRTLTDLVSATEMATRSSIRARRVPRTRIHAGAGGGGASIVSSKTSDGSSAT